MSRSLFSSDADAVADVESQVRLLRHHTDQRRRLADALAAELEGF